MEKRKPDYSSGFRDGDMFSVAAPELCQRDHQQDAHCHTAGNGQGMAADGDKAVRVALHCLLGGIVDAGAGDQRQQRGDQIGDSRVFPDPGHDLCKSRGHNGRHEIA